MHKCVVRIEAVPRVDYMSARLGALRYFWKALKCNFTLIRSLAAVEWALLSKKCTHCLGFRLRDLKLESSS